MQECFTVFASSTQQAASLQLPQAGDEEPDDQSSAQSPVPDTKLLALHSNCAYVRTCVMPRLFSRCAVATVVAAIPAT